MKSFVKYLLVFFSLEHASANFNSQVLRSSNNFTYVLLEDSLSNQILNEKLWENHGPLFNVQFNTVTSPVIQIDAREEEKRDIIKKISTIDILGHWSAGKRLGTSADISFNSVQLNDGEVFGLGDLRLQVEYELYNRLSDPLGVSVVGDLYFPTGNIDAYLSNDSLGTGLTLVGEQNLKVLTASLNIGYAYVGDVVFKNLDYSTQFRVGGGMHVPLSKKFSMNLENYNLFLPNSDFATGASEFYLGGQYALAYNGKFNFGTSLSNFDEDGESDFRVLMGIKFMPWIEEPQKEPLKETVTIVKTIRQCGPERFQQTFSARSLLFRELKTHKNLPYISTLKNQIAIKQIGHMTGMQDGIPYIKNTQILFATDLTGLPSFDSVISIDSLFMKMDVRKVSKDISTDTEIFCILNHSVCSGELFHKSSWRENINQEFFQGKETPNDYFTKKFTEEALKIANKEKVFAADLTLDLKKIIDSSTLKDLKSLLYPKNKKTEVLYFLVADDTYVSNDTYLDISMTVDSCKIKTNEKL